MLSMTKAIHHCWQHVLKVGSSQMDTAAKEIEIKCFGLIASPDLKSVDFRSFITHSFFVLFRTRIYDITDD